MLTTVFRRGDDAKVTFDCLFQYITSEIGGNLGMSSSLYLILEYQ